MLDSLPLPLKLLLLSGVGILALVAAVITGFLGIESGVHGVTEIGRSRLPSSQALQTLAQAQVAQKSSTYEVALWEKENDVQDVFARILVEKKMARREAEHALSTYAALTRAPTEANMLRAFLQEWNAWKRIDDEVANLIEKLGVNTDPARQAALFEQYYAMGAKQHRHYRQSERLLTQMLEYNARQVEAGIQEAEAATTLSARVMVGVGVGAVGLLLLLSGLITLSILRQLGGDPGDAVRLAQRIADGDLSLALPLKPGDRNSLLASMAHMQRRLRETIKRVRQSEKRFHSIFSNMSEGVALHTIERDAAGVPMDYRVIEVNQRYEEMLGLTREAVVGQLGSQIYGTDKAPHLPVYDRVASSGKNAEIEVFYEPMGKHFEISVVPWEGDGFATIFTDATERRRAEERLHRIAHYDALTQLPNRVLLADRFAQAIAQADRNKLLLAVCYLDLDGFKPINDRYGHETGDLLLVEIARRLKADMRGGDTVARLGGDEFVILMGVLANLDECERALDRIRTSIAAPCRIKEAEFSISVSMGITVYPMDDADPDTLMRHADQAMYLAKQSGRNRFHMFDPEQDRQVQARHETLANISAALEAGEFRLYYQPKVDMRLRRLVGVEALLRWQHPQRGLLAPDAFLPALQGSSLCAALSDWVLHTALEQADAWHCSGLPIAISINVPGQQLERPDFSVNLEAALGRYSHLGRECLELEILESATLDDVTQIAAIIERFRPLGVSFALDDFGTGYSSLSYLKRVPAQVLKIDQSFVRNMLADEEDLAIVEGVISLARTFRRKVIAEGVETAAHGERLLQLGCDLAQGFGIAYPMPGDEIPRWTAEYMRNGQAA